MSTIQIRLKIHIEHKTNYMAETIRPWIISEALNYLLTTPLYIKHEIEINEDLMNNYRNKGLDIDFIINEEDKKFMNDQMGINESNNEIIDDDIDEIEDFEINDEVLIINRNKEVAKEYQIIAPGQNKHPLPWHCIEDIDELAFPRIFGGYKFDEQNKLTATRRYKFLCQNKDRRACAPTMILYMAKKKIELSVASSINTCLRKSRKSEKLTCKDALNPERINDLLRYNEGYKFLENVRGSPPYWEKRKKEAFAMIRQLGPPHLFLTLSATETKNCDLLKILYKLKYDKNKSLNDAM